MGYHRKCHWPVNDSFWGWTPWTKVHLYKTVIDQSMTIFASIRNGLSQKIVIDRSMTIFSLREWVITENCHWQVNDIFWGSPIGSWSKQRIIDLSFWLWTYHLWPNVIDHSQWQKFMDKTLKKMSLTMVNDKKIVIYWKVSILSYEST